MLTCGGQERKEHMHHEQPKANEGEQRLQGWGDRAQAVGQCVCVGGGAVQGLQAILVKAR